MISLKEYYAMLEVHDFYYDYADATDVYLQGVSNTKKMLEISKQSKAHEKLLDEFYGWAFSGKPWGTERKPKPEKPEEV